MSAVFGHFWIARSPFHTSMHLLLSQTNQYEWYLANRLIIIRKMFRFRCALKCHFTEMTVEKVKEKLEHKLDPFYHQSRYPLSSLSLSVLSLTPKVRKLSWKRDHLTRKESMPLAMPPNNDNFHHFHLAYFYTRRRRGKQFSPEELPFFPQRGRSEKDAD